LQVRWADTEFLAAEARDVPVFRDWAMGQFPDNPVNEFAPSLGRNAD